MDSVYPYISSTGNFHIRVSAEFLWNDEEVDVEFNNLTDKIRAGIVFADHLWESVEATENIDENGSPIEFDDRVLVSETSCEDGIPVSAASGSRRGKKTLPNHGAEKHKKKILCQRVAAEARPGRLDEDTKSFIQEMFLASFSNLEEKIGKKIDEKMD
ncbi:unnamed protein product [Thlaspi arvense]|uniref:Uncharacterized protein n=1 Tax=Thlaspi arvense TaxID=13288 RepID=A0AAU9RC52_THLAR|nr:unnamed protein product [Thlaspi arvense]